jgi:hypothetical protein
VPKCEIGKLEAMKEAIVAEAMAPQPGDVNGGLAKSVGEFVSVFGKVTDGLVCSAEIGKKLAESAMRLAPAILPVVARGL